MKGNTVACCEKEGVKDLNGNILPVCSVIQCSRTAFWENFGGIRVYKYVGAAMGTMSGIFCSGYNPSYWCEVLDKQGRAVRSCSVWDTRGGASFGGYLNPCGVFPIDSQIGINHSPVLGVSIPVNGSCTISMRVQLPNRHYFCNIFPSAGGCSYSTESFTFGQGNTF